MPEAIPPEFEFYEQEARVARQVLSYEQEARVARQVLSYEQEARVAQKSVLSISAGTT